MSSYAEEITRASMQAMCYELDSAVEKLDHCAAQLSDAQIWWRPTSEMNSIGNLILHLCGNLRQWVTSGIGGLTDDRNRPLEFSERGPIPMNELRQKLESEVASAKAAMMHATPETLLKSLTIQGFAVTGYDAVVHSISHFRGHVQEIVHMTRLQLGDAYRFDFVPATPEEGAP